MNIKLFIILILCCYCDGELKLKKVIIYSRHNVRSPLFRDFQSLSPKRWPNWSVGPGQLTPKGALLETYMGQYISTWLHQHGLFNSSCPADESVFIYANYLNRTINSAKTFKDAAFPNCNIPVHGPTPDNTIFPHLVKNVTEEFLQSGSTDMKNRLDKVNLNDAYKLLNNLSDIKNSKICERKGYCDLTVGKDEVILSVGNYPTISGRLRIGTALADSLLMSFYEGFPIKELWGTISYEDWKLLAKVINVHLRLSYVWNNVRVYINPLLKYLKKAAEDDKKFTAVVGHDSNIAPLLFCLGFERYKLSKQLEDVPIGSKLIFQKWNDGVKDFLKVEYVYQSLNQMRGGEKLTSSNPPYNITMHLKQHEADSNGMYPWSVLQNILNNQII